MFRHKGNRRTFTHNLRLAALLSFIAGIVNVSGVLSLKTLTTNVTGHFAYFAEELVNRNYADSLIFLIFILSFLLGSFVSNLFIEIVTRKNSRVSHAIPIVIEILILVCVGLNRYPLVMALNEAKVIACILLFAMGIQNSMVTQISNSSVRTTHLTGLFTDLGIELSQLFFYRLPNERNVLSKSISLKIIIISFFFLGCVLGGFLFRLLLFKTFFVAAGCLLFALFYDNFRYYIYFTKRKIQRR